MLTSVFSIAFQDMVSSLEKKVDEAEKLSVDRLKQAEEAEAKIIELKTSMQRCCSVCFTLTK